MTSTAPDPWALARRPPAASLITICLDARHAAGSRSAVQRFFGVHPLPPSARSWFIGALGELEAADALAGLGPAWRVIHSVPVGDHDADIDHVVIGPPGVFTINTKRHVDGRVWVSPKLVMVNGQRTDYLRNSRHEARRAMRLLSTAIGHTVRVRACLAFSGIRQPTVRRLPDDVEIAGIYELVERLAAMPLRIAPSEVDAIARVAANPETWRPGVPLSMSGHTMAEFRALRAEVRAARRQRLGALLTLVFGLPIIGMIGLAVIGALESGPLR